MSHTAENAASFLLAGKPSGAVALLTLDRDYAYADVERGSAAVAAYLSTSASLGDRVILVAENSLYWVAAYLGILRAGLVCVPVPETIAPDDFRYVVNATGARVF